MPTTRLLDLPLRHLEHVFSPAGLPLPAKGDTDIGTTSILVRGGAGTGKTTAALALAHAIAKREGGLVLYLTTEFSPVEIAFKATLLGMAETDVDAFPGDDKLPVGGVVVEHLSAVRRGQPVTSSADRKRGVIDAVWGLLHPAKEEEGERKRPVLPVRSVVIDALTLPETGETEGALRSDLVAFVQALESEGISVVLVEELAEGTAAWSSFVVDVVLELSFQPDSETRDLRRKLTLSKCRYSISIPGPHDYGLEEGVPSVWPDLFRVVTIGGGDSKSTLHRVEPPRLCVTSQRKNSWAFLDASIILSPWNKTEFRAISTVENTPSATVIGVDCGVTTTIDHGPNRRVVHEDEGVYAIGWGILSLAKAVDGNTCIFQNVEWFLSRPDTAARIGRLLVALRSIGFMVLIHSPSTAKNLTSLDAVADFDWDGAKASSKLLSPPRHRRQSRWLSGELAIRESIKALIRAFTADELIAAKLSATSKSQPQPFGQTLYRLAFKELAGADLSDYDFSTLVPKGEQENHRAAWFALHVGADWHAGEPALDAAESEEPTTTSLLLWIAICAVVARNLAAINELKALLGSPDEPLILNPLLRALGATKQIDEADRIITEIAPRLSLTPWMQDRLRAEVRLESDDKELLKDATSRLTTLTADETIPLVHRAEIWFNLGTAHDRLGERDAALSAFQRAAELNPLLEAAPAEIARIQGLTPKPEPDTRA